MHDIGQPFKSNVFANYFHVGGDDVTPYLTYLEYAMHLVEEKRSDCCKVASCNSIEGSHLIQIFRNFKRFCDLSRMRNRSLYSHTFRDYAERCI